MNQFYLQLITYYAALYGVDPKLATSVAIVESGMRQDKIGMNSEIGVFQLKPCYFHNIYTAKANIKEGIKYLAQMKKLCPFKDSNTFVVCYNRGLVGAKRDVVRPERDNYYKKVMNIYGRYK